MYDLAELDFRTLLELDPENKSAKVKFFNKSLKILHFLIWSYIRLKRLAFAHSQQLNMYLFVPAKSLKRDLKLN